MAISRLLVVEDDADISRLLRYYFSGLGYQVDAAADGQAALEIARQVMPHLIILDIILPDIDGYEVCKTLRQHTRTSHIPVLFLTQKDERSDRLQGLELGADDYITKPFDIEELRLRVQNALTRSERERLTDPVTCLPAGTLIEVELTRLLPLQDWAVLDVRLNNFDVYRVREGQPAAQASLQKFSSLLTSVIDEDGLGSDFLGHAGGASFIITTSASRAAALAKSLKSRFRKQAGPIFPSSQAPGPGEAQPSLSIGVVTSGSQPFSDIRTITERAAEARRGDSAAFLPQRP